MSSSGTKAKPAQVLKQTTLSFASKRAVSSATSVKPVKTTKKVKTRTSPRLSVSSVSNVSSFSSSDSSLDDLDLESIELTSSDDDNGDSRPSESEERKIEGRAVTAGKKAIFKSSETQKPRNPSAVLQSKDHHENTQAVKQERPELQEKDPRWRDHYALVQAKMGHLRPIHSEGQNKIHEILRVFDMSYEFGPCIGVTRLERWERASALGLNPPIEVRDILSTRQGTEQEELSQPVLNSEV